MDLAATLNMDGVRHECTNKSCGQIHSNINTLKAIRAVIFPSKFWGEKKNP